MCQHNMQSSQEPIPLSAKIAASDPQNQAQSPIFALMYPELRNMIFRHALTEYDDLSRPYSKHGYCYRPGFEFAGKIDTNLLLTCRIIYLETHLAPIALNEHVFWMRRGPPGRFEDDPDQYFARMTPHQCAAVKRVRFFTQLFWLESREAQEWPEGLVIPKLTITIRHTDWWYWENSEPLRMNNPNEGWGKWVGSMPGLQQVELELETIDDKREQLEERVRDALSWTFPVVQGGVLIHDGADPVGSMRLGTSRLSPARYYEEEEGWEEEDDEDEYSGSVEESAEDSDSDPVAADKELAVVPEDTTEIVIQESEGTQLVEDKPEMGASLDAPDYPTEASGSQQLESEELSASEGVSGLNELDRREADLDLRFSIDLKFHVRKLTFVHERVA